MKKPIEQRHIIGERHLRELIKRKLNNGHNYTSLATEFGVSAQFLSKVVRGDYAPGPKIAEKMGYRQVTAFVKEEAAKG